MLNISRREFLKVSAIAASSLLISTGLTGCGDSDSTKEDETLSVAFNHGVASGDPLADKIIIWTRVTPNKSQTIDVNFEVSTDAEFLNVVNNGTYKTSSTEDYTVKVDVQNLTANTQYFYRFKSNGKTSPVGKMKTLATDTPEQVKMAVFTCANYPYGYFNVYDAASKIDDLDVTVHVGDYIYEYGTYKNDDETQGFAYANENAAEIGRSLPANNNTECITLNDYRRRYALYRSDVSTQAIHAACPMIVVWDDHEVANDTYKDGAQNHDDTEGSFSDRTTAALQAYFEWLPIRPIEDKKAIYRSFDFGGLVALHMLETRLFGRDEQLDYADYFDAYGDFDAVSFQTDISSTTRTMLGSDQLQWLQTQLATSSATWQVLGQQVLMGKMYLPSELLMIVSQLEDAEGETKVALLTQLNTLLTELVTIKTRILQGDTTVTEEEEARLTTALPYNLDAWDGYAVERETILATAKTYNKNLVVLAGDTHNAWANNLTDYTGDQVGVEFTTPSVTSPGLEAYASLTDTATAMQFEGAISLLIDNLQYLNAYDRGFMTVTFTANDVTANWQYVSNYNSTQYTLNTTRENSISISNTTTPLTIS